ncbi:MAG: hypothetical protein HQL46_13905, partial [Gammaproteobacteria bacterium]|nr:hypothetical protein [Gammaproteobacteria bacterium]
MKKFAIPFIFLLIVIAIGRYYYHLEAEKKLQQIIQHIAPWILIRYENMDVELDGKIILDKVTAFTQQKKGVFQAERFEILDFKILDNRPIKLALRATSLKFNVLPNLKPGTYGLYNLGYKKVILDMELSYQYNDFANRFLFTTNLDIENLGATTLMLDLANVDIEQWQYYFKDPNSILLIESKLEYQDQGFINKLLGFAKDNKGLNDKEFAQHIENRV